MTGFGNFFDALWYAHVDFTWTFSQTRWFGPLLGQPFPYLRHYQHHNFINALKIRLKSSDDHLAFSLLIFRNWYDEISFEFVGKEPWVIIFFIFCTKFTSIQLSFNPFSTYLATKTKYLDIRESAIFYPHLDFTQLFFDMISV